MAGRGHCGLERVALAVVLLAAAGCEGDPVSPQPQLVNLRVLGGAERYVRGTLSFGTTVVELRNAIVDLRGAFVPDRSRTETVVLELLEEEPIVEGDQTTRRFDRFTTSVLLTPGVVEIDLSVLEPRPLLRLARLEATVLLDDDPCALNAEIFSDGHAVDSDRGLYLGSFSNLVGFTLARSSSYAGGNVFDDGEDRSEFEAACASDGWDLADSLTCAPTDAAGISCLYYAWERLGPAQE